MRGYTEAGVMYGYLRDDSPLSAGNQKFLLWELDAGGSGSSTLLFGVKDGVPYEPEASGSYQFFQKSSSGYTGTLSSSRKNDQTSKGCCFRERSRGGSPFLPVRNQDARCSCANAQKNCILERETPLLLHFTTLSR